MAPILIIVLRLSLALPLLIRCYPWTAFRQNLSTRFFCQRTCLHHIVLKSFSPCLVFSTRPLRGGRFFLLFRPVIDLAWKIAHGVLYTVDCLSSFGYSYDPCCFCGHALESSAHLFFYCPLANSLLSWIQSLLFQFSPTSPPLLLRHALFGFNNDELRRIPQVFVYILNVGKFFPVACTE